MRDLTFEEIDEQLAEQLPSRELMGSCGRSSCCNPCDPCCQPKCEIEIKVCVAL
jgi:hypothetical protein